MFIHSSYIEAMDLAALSSNVPWVVLSLSCSLRLLGTVCLLQPHLHAYTHYDKNLRRVFQEGEKRLRGSLTVFDEASYTHTFDLPSILA